MFWSQVSNMSNPAASAALRSSPFLSRGDQFISVIVRVSCCERKPRTFTGTFLSNSIRNAVTFGVRQDCLHLSFRYFELLRNLRHAQTIFCIVDNGAHGQARPD